MAYASLKQHIFSLPGFDPCAESFKGLADLIEKENGMQQNLSVPSQNRLAPSPPQSSGYPLSAAPPSPQQNNTQPIRNLPPGFSMSHIQQQQQQQLQQQHFLRPGKYFYLAQFH